MTIAPRFDDPAQVMLDVIALEQSSARTSEDIFVGQSHFMPHGRVYGGQVLAQTVAAGALTVDDELIVHSLHGYFLRPGDIAQPITYGVDRIHDGRSFARRRVQGYQDGVPIFSAILSFQRAAEGFEHQLPMPEVPSPDELGPDEYPAVLRESSRGRLLDAHPVEARHVSGHLYGPRDPDPHQAVWLRVRRSIGPDPLLHQCALAYLSDHTIQEPVLRGAGLGWGTQGLRVASLDHAMWWHHPARADEWLLYVQDATSAQGGRGLTQARLYAQDGTIVASVAQEVMARVPND